MSDHEPIQVLLVEDNPGDVRLIREALADTCGGGIVLDNTPTLGGALKHLEAGRTDLVLLDLSLPDSQGLESIGRLLAHAPEIPVVVLTGLNDEAIAVEAVRQGAQDYLVKGQTNGHLLARAIRYAIERHRMQAALRILSLVDELTGLYNRRGFLTLGEHQARLAQRKKTGFYLLFADLDDMKVINDTWGHATGDQALVETARLLTETFRGSDIIARMGGDEFAVITVDSDSRGAEAIVRRFQERVAVFNADRSHPFTLAISVGIVHYTPDSGLSLETLVDEADRLMYEEKRRRKAARGQGSAPR